MMQRVLAMLLIFCSFIIMADDTVLKLYRPYGEVIEQITPLVKNTLSGQCLGQSELILREDAWRCQAEGKIFDPCFAKPAGTMTKVVCPQSPWVADSQQIVLQVPLNNARHTALDMSTAYPWAIELVNGEHCQAVAATEQYDGMPVRYACADHHVLFGRLQRCRSVWSMLEKTASGVEIALVKRAWF